MNTDDAKLFSALRTKVADYIRNYLLHDCGHKSYEGTWEIIVSYPDYFDDPDAKSEPEFFQILLHCYIIGPERHYSWEGETLNEALIKCKSDIDRWIGI